MFAGGILTIYFLFGNIFKITNKIVERIYQQINSFHPTIKFTAPWSKEKVDFSDVEVTLKSGVLSTCLFFKPTETQQFLDTTSCHSYQCKKGMPYSQKLRLDRFASIILIMIKDVRI